MNEFPIVPSVALLAGAVLSACASHPPTPATDPVALAAVHADLRLVRGETTWVTRGRGYELVARSRADLAVVQPGLDRAATFLAQIYPGRLGHADRRRGATRASAGQTVYHRGTRPSRLSRCAGRAGDRRPQSARRSAQEQERAAAERRDGTAQTSIRPPPPSERG